MGQSLIEIWKHRGKILEGIKNSVFKNEHVEEIAEARNKICQGCDDIDKSGDKCFIPGSQPCCGICGCSLHLLQRSLSSSCEAGRWPAVLSEEEADTLHENLNPEK
jgi:hypothetical protein